MAITKMSSLIILSLMMLTFIYIPMISGQFRGIKQCEMKCYSTPECNATCLHEGYEEGKCLKSWDGGVECCYLGLLASSHQDSSPICSPH
ncbi:unnamed protein product [Arabidopsis thaliana]|uniref:Defensin-like domain-containing protein n=1 Tax=Arabidopsis thaliana TaxID=3702 RepID=A0A5S9WXF9_ARATH|nr:unnamed protein product [Arabidopsis thaliana]